MGTLITSRRILFATAIVCNFSLFGQIKTKTECWNSLLNCENDATLSDEQKLKTVEQIKNRFEALKFSKDSVYARIMHRLGLYYYSSKQLNKAVAFTLEAVKINVSGKAGSNKKFAAKSYQNLGYYYTDLELNETALDYFDSATMVARRYPDLMQTVLECRSDRCNIFYNKGDIQKCIDEANLGINEAHGTNNVLYEAVFLNNRAKGNLLKDKPADVKEDATRAQVLAEGLHAYFEVARSQKLKGFAYGQLQQFDKALQSFRDCIVTRKKSGDIKELAGDYIDAGNLLLNKIKNYEKAASMYSLAVKYGKAGGSTEASAIAHINFGVISLLKKDYAKGLKSNSVALSILTNQAATNPLVNPLLTQLMAVSFKDMVLTIFSNRTELLLLLYKQTGDKKFLQASLKTALLTDSLITFIRHKQAGEQSKLYWRNRTREFFMNALEACYEASDHKLAFFFMEKSRAVLLNDKLNELGAFARLPQREIINEQLLRSNVVVEQQKLTALDVSSALFNNQQLKVLHARDEFDRYIRSLEKNYPVYFQYRYADEVPSLKTLQQHLQAGKQSFIHYFLSDTVVYILSITPNHSQLKKLGATQFTVHMFSDFLQLCSDKMELMNNYPKFAALSHKLYANMFEPGKVPRGRVVVCPDNFIIPFEALCSDANGKNFLVYDYAFSYVYSAQYLLKKFEASKAKQNFIGFAPVSFKTSLNVPSLTNSGNALAKSGSFYNSSTLLTNESATRKNFIDKIGSYGIVNVFSHARADSGDSEPLLFMQDSIIQLSELQLLNNPATELVVLSACQTNVGKNATGEGIYSLARGFTSAGIPSVASTLWKADERTIYAISEKFHGYLAGGTPKDEALQRAKKDFMQQGHEKLMPYYWANIIIMGNSKPVELVKDRKGWWWIFSVGVIMSVALIVLMRKRRTKI